MVSVNRVFVAGNLTRDPELKTIQNGQAVCNFSLAVNRKWNDRQSGEKKEEVSFFDVECWGRTAEIVAQYLKKGRPTLVEGRLKQDRWETDDGSKRSRVKILAENVQFLGGRDENGGAVPKATTPAPEEISDDIPF